MSKFSEIDLKRFAAQVKTRRGDMWLRAAATEIGEVSAPTLSRVEQESVPDLDTYIRICRWLGKSPEEFMTGKKRLKEEGTPEFIEAHLRADKTLSSDTIEALSRMVHLAYDAAKKGKI
ncbi:XRE family transcriptional regulator [Verrucomicrobiota bacterium]